MSPNSFTADEYERRHHRVLQHCARYRLILPACVTRTFGIGKALPHVYTRLEKQGVLKGYKRVLPGGNSCYVLTAQGCKAVNAPLLRSNLPEGPALDLAIAVSVFCHLGKRRRHRVESFEASQLLGTPMPTNLAYAMTDELDGNAALLRAVSAASLSVPECIRTLRVLLDQTRCNSKLIHFVDARQYGFAILASTTQTLVALEKAIAKSGIRTCCPVVSGLGPTAETLAAALKEKGH